MKFFGVRGCEITREKLIIFLSLSQLWLEQHPITNSEIVGGQDHPLAKRYASETELDTNNFTWGLCQNIVQIISESNGKNANLVADKSEMMKHVSEALDYLYGKYRYKAASADSFWGDGNLPKLFDVDGEELSEETLFSMIAGYIGSGSDNQYSDPHNLTDGEDGEGENSIQIFPLYNEEGEIRSDKFVIGVITSHFEVKNEKNRELVDKVVDAALTIYDQNYVNEIYDELPSTFFKEILFDQSFVLPIKFE